MPTSRSVDPTTRLAASPPIHRIATNKWWGNLPAQKVVLTLGDACGIGPEVTAKSLASLKKDRSVSCLVAGKASFFNALAKKLSIKISFEDISDLRQWKTGPGPIPCYFDRDFPKKINYGRSQAVWSELAVRSIDLAARLAMKGAADCIVTAPVNKAGLKQAGFKMPGHTEYLAKLSRTKHYEMMLVGGPLRVILVTRHMAIREVSRAVTAQRVAEVIGTTDLELRRSFGIQKPRIVVCGLNPHAGEAGSFGNEEIRVIAPAVRSARKKTNAEIIGPLSPDALFVDAYRGRYDAEICMYHDQGLIPLKMISRGGGVNVTLGLPFVRTSPDHGTAYDIAGKFVADPGSMIEAIKLAVSISKNRKKFQKKQCPT